MKTSFVKNLIKGVRIGFDKHSPEILIGLGIASAITSTVLSERISTSRSKKAFQDQKLKMDFQLYK